MSDSEFASAAADAAKKILEGVASAPDVEEVEPPEDFPFRPGGEFNDDDKAKILQSPGYLVEVVRYHRLQNEYRELWSSRLFRGTRIAFVLLVGFGLFCGWRKVFEACLPLIHVTWAPGHNPPSAHPIQAQALPGQGIALALITSMSVMTTTFGVGLVRYLLNNPFSAKRPSGL